MTSFLYERNRPRRSDEFTNSWKWDLAAERKAKELGLADLETYDDVAGLSFLDKDYLVRKISELLTTQTMNRGEVDSLRESIHNLHKENDTLVLRKHEAEAISRDLTTKLEYMKEKVSGLIRQLNLFGDHKTECEWIDLVSSGRICEGKTEKNTCDCGWSIVQEEE